MSIRNKLLEEILSAINSGGGGGGNAPTENENHTIGSGGDYPTLTDFLLAQQQRAKSEYTVTGTILNGHVISYVTTINSGDFTNVFIESEWLSVDVSTTTTPFNFVGCVAAPYFDFNINLTGLISSQNVFNYTGCVVPIGDHNITSSGGLPPKYVYQLERCDSFMAYFGNSYQSCSDTIFHPIGGSLMLNSFSIDTDCKALDDANAGTVSTAVNFDFPATVTHSVINPLASPLFHFGTGCEVSSLHIQGAGIDYGVGTPVVAEGATLTGIEITYTKVNEAMHVTNSNAREIVIDVDEFTTNSIHADKSSVTATLNSVANGGGTVLATESTIHVNKADNVTASKGSIVYIGTLANLTGSENTPTKNGLIMAGNAATRAGEQTVAAGFTYSPQLALNLQFINLHMIVNVRDVANDLLNSYDVKLINRPSGVEVISVTDIGTTEHAYTDGAAISADIDSGYVRLLVPTTGSGEDLLIDYDLYYTR